MTKKWSLVCSGVLLPFLVACSDSDKEAKTAIPEPSVVQGSPLETETPKTQNPPDLFNCVGENFDKSQQEERLSEFDHELDLANWLYDGKTEVLSNDKLELISSFSKNEDLATLSLRSKKDINLLFSVQQEPFHGFLQAGIRQADIGGWAQCEGSIESLRELTARPLRCFALWTTSSRETKHFAFPIEAPSDEWQAAFETANFQLMYRSTEHFVLYKIVDMTSRLELASVMTDRYFSTSRAVFNFNPLFVSIDCKSEGI